jgi:hypothetical protein
LAEERPEPAGGLEVEVLETEEGLVVRLRGEASLAEEDAPVGLAPDLHPAVRAALNRVELMGLSEAGGGAEPGPGAAGARKMYPSVDDVQRAFGVTWGEVVELEPRVEALLGRARRAGAHCRTLADVAWAFGPVRDELAGLIGFAGERQRHPVLGSDGAFEVAYWKLYDAVAGSLPDSPDGAAEAAPPCDGDGFSGGLGI